MIVILIVYGSGLIVYDSGLIVYDRDFNSV